MTLLHRVRALIANHGVAAIGTKAVGQWLDHRFEWRYGIDTIQTMPLSELDIDPASLAHATTHYEASRVMPLRALMRRLGQSLADPIGLVDCGCGKGKPLLIAAECGIERIVGVEFSEQLCEIARSNWERFRIACSTQSNVEILHRDICRYEIDCRDNAFFLFNPFDASVFRQLLNNIAASLESSPRKIVIAIAFMMLRIARSWPCFRNSSW